MLAVCTQVDKENVFVNQAAAPPPQDGSDPCKRGKGHQHGVIAKSFHLDNSLVNAILAAAESAQVGTPIQPTQLRHIQDMRIQYECMYSTSVCASKQIQ